MRCLTEIDELRQLEEDLKAKMRRAAARAVRTERHRHPQPGPLIGNCIAPGVDVKRYLQENLIRA